MVRLTQDMVHNLVPGSLNLVETLIVAVACDLYYDDAGLWQHLSHDEQDAVKQIKYVGYLRS